ncbi:hypothetical protein DFS34DRAFT_130080 [Phlyctochytrium arcticum]|nr:hypothetical protein DFS34DRAFT_130080 [Phlyctochytrium arcticum]
MPAKEANEKPQAAPVAEAGKERKKVVAKPDQAAYERDLKEVDNNIETLKKKLAQASDRLNGSDNIRDEFTDRRKQLRDSQDVLTKQRNEIGDKRRKLIDQIKSIQANLRKKNDDTRSSKDRLGYKSVAEVDQQIAYVTTFKL